MRLRGFEFTYNWKLYCFCRNMLFGRTGNKTMSRYSENEQFPF